MQLEFSELALIRLGYGFGPDPAQRPGIGTSPATLVAEARQAVPLPDAMTTQQAGHIWRHWRDLSLARKGDTPGGDQVFVEFSRAIRRLGVVALNQRVARALDTRVGFGERLVQFWSDHFTIRPDGPMLFGFAMAFETEAIRPHLAGWFENMLFAAVTHPMMLLFLNQTQSYGPNSEFVRRRKGRGLGLNENLAREVIELHTLGVGASYTQRDVREFAELLTGLSYTGPDAGSFSPGRAEPGAETVLGKVYGGGDSARLDDIRVALRDLARHPATARHMARKLAVHFVSDDPDPALIDAMAAEWQATGGNLPRVYRVLMTHPALQAQFRQKIRQPLDYVVTALRALGVSGAQIRALPFKDSANMLSGPIARMGQPWWRPIGPDGWPEAASHWITPQSLSARVSWTLWVPSRLAGPLSAPDQLLETALGRTAGEPLRWAVPKSESLPEAVSLILASTELNRR